MESKGSGITGRKPRKKGRHKMAIITKGNPFTHPEEKRESWVNIGDSYSCNWCGQSPKTLYKYNDTRGWFCNKKCWNGYRV